MYAQPIDGTWHALYTGMKSIMKENCLSLEIVQFLNHAHYGISSLIEKYVDTVFPQIVSAETTLF